MAPMDLASPPSIYAITRLWSVEPIHYPSTMPSLGCTKPAPLCRALNNAAIAAVIAAATAGEALVDDDCARKAVAELYPRMTSVFHSRPDHLPADDHPDHPSS